MLNSKILIVDDDLTISKFITANLRAEGYEIFVANSGHEAIEITEKEQPDLIILATVMKTKDKKPADE